MCFNRLQIEFCGRPPKGIPIELSDAGREHVDILVPARCYQVWNHPEIAGIHETWVPWSCMKLQDTPQSTMPMQRPTQHQWTLVITICPVAKELVKVCDRLLTDCWLLSPGRSFVKWPFQAAAGADVHIAHFRCVASGPYPPYGPGMLEAALSILLLPKSLD